MNPTDRRLTRPRARRPRRGSIAMNAVPLLYRLNDELTEPQIVTITRVIDALMAGGHTLSAADIERLADAITEADYINSGEADAAVKAGG